MTTGALRYHANVARGWVLDWRGRARWRLAEGLALGAEVRGGEAWMQGDGMFYWYF
jgi:hypothetical protein